MVSAWPPMRLDDAELRAITDWAATCALQVLDLFEADRPGDVRPREAVEAAQRFADGARRDAALRACAWAWAARAAARQASAPAAVEAALAASTAARAAYLHPLASPTQVHHVLDAAVHHARALELAAGGDRDVDQVRAAWAAGCAPAAVAAVLARMPPAPTGRTRRAALLTGLDTQLRG